MSITFFPVDWSAQNFQGHLNSLQVIFWWVTWTPGPSGSGPDPEKWVLREIYLLPGFSSEGVVSYLFGICTTRQKKCWERNFDFLPRARENGAERPGWPARRQTFWNFDFFHKRDPCPNGVWVLSYFMQLCRAMHPVGCRGPGQGPGPKIKNWNFNFFYKSKVVVDPILRLFGYLQLFDRMHPQGPRALGKVRKRPWDYCLVNKMLEFGLSA